MLDIKNLSASIENKDILQDINLTLRPGTTTALLGPNGSGKSTLGNAIMGAPFITYGKDARISFHQEKDITKLPPEERAQLGFFMTFQNPLPLSGVSVMDIFRATLVTGKNKKHTSQELYDLVHRYCEELALPKEFLRRSLHEGFSGGEKKKMEALQAAVFQPKVIVFDELDTGVDVDALKIMTRFLQKNLSPDSIRIFITHSHKLLTLYHPDQVVVLKNGRLVKTGGRDLAEEIEKNGFESL